MFDSRFKTHVVLSHYVSSLNKHSSKYTLFTFQKWQRRGAYIVVISSSSLDVGRKPHVRWGMWDCGELCLFGNKSLFAYWSNPPSIPSNVFTILLILCLFFESQKLEFVRITWPVLRAASRVRNFANHLVIVLRAHLFFKYKNSSRQNCGCAYIQTTVGIYSGHTEGNGARPTSSSSPV